MPGSSPRELSEVIMREFAAATGLEPPRRDPERYLWTDAFAVCNFCGLFEATGNPDYSRLAVRLVDQVHHTLGRHRADDNRSGWISGLSGNDGERHPTRGGLRIGKNLPERGSCDPYDERLEWDRDGQYFHYLTRWMHALERVGTTTGNPGYHTWAVELAIAAHDGFTAVSPDGGEKRMYWKMSTDLTRPLVPAMGQHDPLDGWVTCRELLASRSTPVDPGNAGLLDGAVADYLALCKKNGLLTGDPLGIGGLLADAGMIARIAAGGNESPGLSAVLGRVLLSACRGMEIFLRQDVLSLPADCRLGFRELGLSIGLAAIRDLPAGTGPGSFLNRDPVRGYLAELAEYLPVKSAIERFWMESRVRGAGSWKEHRWINEVMLATSLSPEGFLAVRPGAVSPGDSLT